MRILTLHIIVSRLHVCVHREQIMFEQKELIKQEDGVQHDIVEVVEKCRLEEAKYQANVQKCSKVGLYPLNMS